MSKKTFVTLVAIDAGVTKSFDVVQATKLLRYKKTMWQPVEGEKLVWDGNVFKPRQNKLGDKESE